jgi:hypothetical protein
MAPRYVYGRRVKGPGVPPKRVKRVLYAYLPGTETYTVIDGVVGKPTSVVGATKTRRSYFNPKLRLRRLACGHGVFMLRGQHTDASTFCVQCRDGVKVR